MSTVHNVNCGFGFKFEMRARSARHGQRPHICTALRRHRMPAGQHPARGEAELRTSRVQLLN
jgi:hypothetical protein